MESDGRMSRATVESGVVKMEGEGKVLESVVGRGDRVADSKGTAGDWYPSAIDRASSSAA
jgi:hypothetical protein